MENHVKEERWIDVFGPVDEFIQRLRDTADGLKEPKIIDDGWGDSAFFIEGWRPMTEKELERARKKREAAKKAAKARKEKQEAAERAELERLKAKYGEK